MGFLLYWSLCSCFKALRVPLFVINWLGLSLISLIVSARSFYKLLLIRHFWAQIRSSSNRLYRNESWAAKAQENFVGLCKIQSGLRILPGLQYHCSIHHGSHYWWSRWEVIIKWLPSNCINYYNDLCQIDLETLAYAHRASFVNYSIIVLYLNFRNLEDIHLYDWLCFTSIVPFRKSGRDTNWIESYQRINEEAQ